VENWRLDLSDDDFWAFSELVFDKAGINLHQGKKELVRTRLARRIREGGFDSFKAYYDYVIQDDSGDELVHLLDAISTNLTSFFRESKHFDFMVDRFLPEVVASRKKGGARRLRIWSAGCSTGEEPYSIAMAVLEALPEAGRWDLRILATDLSTTALGTAWRGLYHMDRLTGVPPDRLRRYFQKGRGDWEDWYRVKEGVRSKVAFRRLNLVHPFPFKGRFHLVFCRNVMIYFNKETQNRLVSAIHQVIEPGGYLFIGHSESLTGLDHRYQYVQPTIYRK